MKTQNQLTATQQDYLRAIYYLKQKNDEVKSVQVAKYLNLTKQTVTERLQTLAAQGYLEYKKYGSASLTPQGQKVAEKLTTKHRLIEVFLHSILKRPINEVHDEAHKLEHAFSDASIKALQKLLRNPSTDPHGSPIHI